MMGGVQMSLYHAQQAELEQIHQHQSLPVAVVAMT